MTRCFRCQSALLTRSRDDEVVCVACGRCQNPLAPLPKWGAPKAKVPWVPRERPSARRRPCAECRTPFVGRTSYARYCSVRCSNRAAGRARSAMRPTGADALSPLQLAGSVKQYAVNDATKRRAVS